MKRARKGSGSFTDLGRKGWRYRFTVGGERKSVTARTQEECRIEAAKKVDEYERNLPGGATEPLASFLTRWLTRQESRLRPRTVKAYRSALHTHVIPVLGKVTLADLSHRDVERMTALASRAGAAPRTANMAATVLGTALRDAMRDGVIDTNPVALAHPIRAARTPRNMLAPVEIADFLEAKRGSRWWPEYVVALSLGLRQGELLGLRWEDVADGRVRVTHTLRAAGGLYYLDPPKTVDSAAVLPLPAPVATALAVQREIMDAAEVHAGKGWAHGYDGLGLIFRSNHGRPVEGKRLTEAFQRDLADCGLPRQRFHDLRHWTASYLLSQGVDLKVIQAILRHSTITVTADTYSHPSQALMRDALGRLDWLTDGGAVG